jgi:hypothetical protein
MEKSRDDAAAAAARDTQVKPSKDVSIATQQEETPNKKSSNGKELGPKLRCRHKLTSTLIMYIL